MATRKFQQAKEHHLPTKAAKIWLILIGFSLVNINILASWYNKSATAAPESSDYVSGNTAPASNSSEAREIRALVKRVNSLTREHSQSHAREISDLVKLTKEHSQFQKEIVGQIDSLKKKVDNALLAVATMSSAAYP